MQLLALESSSDRCSVALWREGELLMFGAYVCFSLTVEYGLREEECRLLNEPFVKHVTTGRPFVVLKSALTLDGRTATEQDLIRLAAGQEERNRLARELHDSAKQKAFASLAQLGAARSLLSNNIGAARKHLGEAENLVSEVIQELTFLIQEMYPIALKEKGLPNALREYIFEWETRTDIRVNLQIEGEAHLGLEIEQAVFRIIQESLANVARHSQATRVEFNVVYRTDGIEVCISDNGCGFDLEQKPNGIGLRSMRERAKSVGGTVDIQSSPGKGTQVIVKVPAPPLKNSNGGRNG